MSKFPSDLYGVRTALETDSPALALRVVEWPGYIAVDVLESSEWVEVANCTRYTRTEGASFTGWVVRDRHGNHTDPIAIKHDAMRNLAHALETCLKAEVFYGRRYQRLLDRFAPIDA